MNDDLLNLLRNLSTGMLNRPKDTMGMEITLFVGGTILCGSLLDEDSFKKLFMDGFLLTELEPESGGATFSDHVDYNSSEFLHLLVVKLFLPQYGQVDLRGGNRVWRGRISSIDGYMPGILDFISPTSC